MSDNREIPHLRWRMQCVCKGFNQNVQCNVSGPVDGSAQHCSYSARYPH